MTGRASAPGKVVLSGAYAVLEGTPAIVSAVDRRAFADASGSPEFTTDEVAAALELGWLERAPAFDASSQREDGRKLGLGSSAAILVASLLASDPGLGRTLLFERALAAHRRAQGGGSGVDVAASVYGGTLAYQLDEHRRPTVTPITLPQGLVVEVWSSPVEAHTRSLIERVEAARATAPSEHRAIFDELDHFGRAALDAVLTGSAAALVAALCGQAEGLWRLGRLAVVPIRTDAVSRLDALARDQEAVVLPAGAGGGDVCIYAGTRPPSAGLLAALPAAGHTRLALAHDAEGASMTPNA
jgi:phosphomevalonate kinase